MITEEKYQICPRCKSQNLIRQTGDDEPTAQYGRLICGDCTKFLGWLKDPSITLELQERQRAIATILIEHKSKLNTWEQGFLKSIYNKRWLTAKQRERLNVVGLRCLKTFIFVPDHLRMHSG